jgi:hypothetical protein
VRTDIHVLIYSGAQYSAFTLLKKAL